MNPRGLPVLLAALSLASPAAITPASAQGQRADVHAPSRPDGRGGMVGAYGRPQAWFPQAERGVYRGPGGASRGYPAAGVPARGYPSQAYPSGPYPVGAYPPQPYPERAYPRAPYAEPAARFREGGPSPAPVGADWRNEQDEARQAVREGRHIPLGQAIGAVRRRTAGRELDANLEAGPNGRSVYRLRWATTDGRRIDYLVDAATGAIIGAQGGR